VARILVTSLADADAAQIIADLGAKAGKRVATRFLATFEKLYDRLAAHPDSGAPRPRLGERVRICVVSPYIVIYEHIAPDDMVMILRIVHGRRKITRGFLGGA
jgi:toxin ParE1/3/4